MGTYTVQKYSEQFTRVQFKSHDRHSLDKWMLTLRNFRKIISFFIGQKIKFEKIIFTSNELHSNLNKSDELPLTEFELLFNDDEDYGILPKRPIYFIYFKDIAVDFAKIIEQWFVIVGSPVAPVTSLLLESITDHRYFEENDFIRAWHGVEAFHRIVLQDTTALKKKFNIWYDQIRKMIVDPKLLKKLDGKLTYGYEMPAPNRLMEIIKENYDTLELSPVTLKKIDGWIKEMSNSRNYLTHYEPNMAEKRSETQRLIYFTSLLKALLTVSILRHLGINERLLKKLATNPVFYYRPLLKI